MMIRSLKSAKNTAAPGHGVCDASFGRLRGAPCLLHSSLCGGWLAALMLGAPAASIGPSKVQAQALAQAEPRLQPVRHAPLEELPRPRARQRLLLPAGGLVIMEEQPKLIGGLGGLLDKVRYPPQARENRIEGEVLISFVVNEEGRVEQAAIEQGLGDAINEEVLRVVREAQFEPGVQTRMTPDGNWIRRPVRVPMTLPFTFKLHQVLRPELPQRHWSW